MPLVAAGLLAAGCAGPPPGTGGVPGFSIESRAIGPGDYVEVTARHASLDHRVEEIALVGPDGGRYPAKRLDTESYRESGGYGGSPNVGVGVHGGSGGHVGVGLGLSFLLGGAPSHTSFRTTATIAVPDPAAYRAGPERWQVSVVLRHREEGPRRFDEPAPVPES